MRKTYKEGKELISLTDLGFGEYRIMHERNIKNGKGHTSALTLNKEQLLDLKKMLAGIN
ncbi:MAG: hypothetical protein ACOCQR_00785 [bacterium]